MGEQKLIFGGTEPVAEAPDLEAMARDALKRIKEAEDYWNDFFSDMEDDFRFVYTCDHWDEKAKRARGNRPMLSIPLIKKFVSRIMGESRKSPAGIKVSPRGGEDKDKAEFFGGTIRYIEDRCGATYAYNHALECAVAAGLGFYRTTYKTVENGSRTVLVQERIGDPLKVLFDPDSRDLDGGDAKHATVWGERKNADGTKVKTYEHYWVDESGRVLWCLLEGSEVLYHGEWPVAGCGVPIFPVYGQVQEFGGERVIQGVARGLIDMQRSYNYLESERVEIIALTPRPPVVGPEGSFVNPDEWDRAASEPVPRLEYKAFDDQTQQPLPPPSRMVTTPDVQWVTQAMGDIKQHFHDVTGIYDSNLGNDPRALSGRAILARQEAGDYSQLEFTEHLQVSLQRSGNMLLKMIPVVMGNQQMFSIMGEDGVAKTIPVSGLDKDGKPYRLDLDPSDLDLSVSAEPAYATRRQEFVDKMQSVLSTMPQAAAMIADLVVGSMDFPGASEAAERLYKSLPPELKEKQGWVPQEIADQMQQKTQTAIQNLQQQLAQANAKAAQLEHQLKQDREMELARERMRSETTLAKTEMEQQGQAQLAAMEIGAKQEADNAKLAADVLKAQAENPPVVVAPVPVPQAQPAPMGGMPEITYRQNNPLA